MKTKILQAPLYSNDLLSSTVGLLAKNIFLALCKKLKRKIDQLRLGPEILDTCTIGILVSKECIKVQNGFPYISKNEPTIGCQQYEY